MAMLSLRAGAPKGEWLTPENEALFDRLRSEAALTPDGDDGLVLCMMNIAWAALNYLSALAEGPKVGVEEWLSRIALDLESD